MITTNVAFACEFYVEYKKEIKLIGCFYYLYFEINTSLINLSPDF
ncbi:hypothetical protein COO91_00236 [Nostoc flagelliforme CCNUN1]|uniref:Uncharacterized protein n=1 Tax=Nostoc flagelliforme CCNUN1 TaxID=2038116 RepID=A0A2K8SG55_9NOSO|nr:hypothetical protein COO91_00236 [Nostoc flagelliforme CCNUN1]